MFDQDKNPATKDDQLYVKGSASGSVTVTAYVDLDWLDDPEKVAAHSSASAFRLRPGPLTSSVRMEAKARGWTRRAPRQSGSTALRVPDLGFRVRAPGERGWTGGGEAVHRLQLAENLRLGQRALRFGRRDQLRHVDRVCPIGTKSGPKFVPPTIPKPEYQPPVVEVSLSSDVKVAVGPRLSLLFWDSFGPSASIKAFGKVHADSEKTPCWSVGAGAEANIGIRVRIPWKLFGLEDLGKVLGLADDIASKTFGPFSIFETNDILSGGCSGLPVNVYPPGEGPTDEVYKDPRFSPWSRRYLDWSTSFPHSARSPRMNLHTDKTIDGAWLVGGRGIQGVMKLSESGDVVWAKRIHLPGVDDEEVAFDEAKSAFAVQALDTNIWVATSRFTVMKVESGRRPRLGEPLSARRRGPPLLGRTDRTGPAPRRRRHRPDGSRTRRRTAGRPPPPRQEGTAPLVEDVRVRDQEDVRSGPRRRR